MDTYGLDSLTAYATKRGWGMLAYLRACDIYREDPEYYNEKGWTALERVLDGEAGTIN